MSCTSLLLEEKTFEIAFNNNLANKAYIFPYLLAIYQQLFNVISSTKDPIGRMNISQKAQKHGNGSDIIYILAL